ncbi:MAG: HAMP domain-containing histidine kinase [Oscillospiraceae bacterium]|nr:HAMP domain-containing histidine kinase [Oscillospiraceae bacterium]
MNEEKLINKQLIRNMIYNLIAFTAIFTAFGVIIYNQVRISVYSDAESELLRYQNTSANLISSDDETETTQSTVAPNPTLPFPSQIGRIIVSPKVTYLLRDKDGNVLNATSVGRIYNEYLSNLSFDKNNIGQIYDIKVSGKYTFKGITFKSVDSNNQTEYIQLLINVDSETAILNNLLKILIIGTTCAITFAIIASYILSRESLVPVVKAWKKQTEFTQNASHEIRTPLTVMQLKQEQLLKNPNSTILEKVDDINLTLDEIGRLTKLTTDLMTLARADANMQEIKKEKIDIDSLIQEVAKPYVELAELQNKKIIFKLNYKKEIMIDANKMHQLMVILLDNSIKYTGEGDSIEVVTYAKDNHCMIEVKDTGIGISEEGRKHVFDRFYRDDKARSRESGGTGLGLAIAHWIVSVHGGSIKALKNEPKGTIMLVKLK